MGIKILSHEQKTENYSDVNNITIRKKEEPSISEALSNPPKVKSEENEGMSTMAKIGIGAGVATVSLALLDVIAFNGAHIKKIVGSFQKNIFKSGNGVLKTAKKPYVAPKMEVFDKNLLDVFKNISSEKRSFFSTEDGLPSILSREFEYDGIKYSATHFGDFKSSEVADEAFKNEIFRALLGKENRISFRTADNKIPCTNPFWKLYNGTPNVETQLSEKGINLVKYYPAGGYKDKSPMPLLGICHPSQLLFKNSGSSTERLFIIKNDIYRKTSAKTLKNALLDFTNGKLPENYGIFEALSGEELLPVTRI